MFLPENRIRASFQNVVRL